MFCSPPPDAEYIDVGVGNKSCLQVFANQKAQNELSLWQLILELLFSLFLSSLPIFFPPFYPCRHAHSHINKHTHTNNISVKKVILYNDESLLLLRAPKLSNDVLCQYRDWWPFGNTKCCKPYQHALGQLSPFIPLNRKGKGLGKSPKYFHRLIKKCPDERFLILSFLFLPIFFFFSNYLKFWTRNSSHLHHSTLRPEF